MNTYEVPWTFSYFAKEHPRITVVAESPEQALSIASRHLKSPLVLLGIPELKQPPSAVNGRA